MNDLLELAIAAHGGLDLGARAHDAAVGQQTHDIALTEARDRPWIETPEGTAKGVALAKDDAPGQTGLERLEHQHFP